MHTPRVVTQPDIELRHVCGFEYVILNRRDARDTLNWRIPGGTATEVALPKPGARSLFSWVALRTRDSVPVQLFRGATLVQTVMPSGTTCFAARPPIAQESGVPRNARSASTSAGKWVVAREYYVVAFGNGASAIDIQRMLTAFGGVIVGGLQGFDSHVVKLPDPGPSYADVDRTLAALRAESIVDNVVAWVIQGM